MSENDKLFSFLDSLKSWAQQELHRRNITNVIGTITVVERFIDFVSLRTFLCIVYIILQFIYTKRKKNHDQR